MQIQVSFTRKGPRVNYGWLRGVVWFFPVFLFSFNNADQYISCSMIVEWAYQQNLVNYTIIALVFSQLNSCINQLGY